jgi:hypothetical protein
VLRGEIVFLIQEDWNDASEHLRKLRKLSTIETAPTPAFQPFHDRRRGFAALEP